MDTRCKFYCYRKTRAPNHYKTNRSDKIKLVLFDMDGVLTDIVSSWKYIHDYFGTCNDRSVDDYLKGKIDDMEFIKRDVSLWKENGKPVRRDKLVEILSDVPLMKGSKKCITTLKNHKIKTAIVSAGLDILAERVSKEVGIDYFFANGVKTDNNGFISSEGLLEVQLMYKDKNVIKLSNQLNIPLEQIAAVGNSCFDIPMLETCGLGVAFNPGDDCIKQTADIVVYGDDLSMIIPALEKFI